ncbi:MAG: IS3 family transposase [Bifidobacterium sp.]|jgi:putative transposase
MIDCCDGTIVAHAAGFGPNAELADRILEKAVETSPDNAAVGGFFGRMKVEAVHSEQWEERARDEVLALIDECIHWRNHERIKQSLDWKSPAQHRINQGMAA